MPTTLLWLRRDLRLLDHPALGEAVRAADGGRVLPVFVLDPALLGTAGPVRTRCLYQALTSVREAYDGALVLRSGRPAEVIPALAQEVGAVSVHVSAESTPYGQRRDQSVRAALGERGIPLVATGSPYAIGPGTLTTGAGGAYQVFTPFSRAWRGHGWPGPAPVPPGLSWLAGVDGEALPELRGGTADTGVTVELPDCTEKAAHDRLADFLDADLADYGKARDRPDIDGTSGLSMHLKYGTLHPRTVLAAVAAHPAGALESANRFVTEIAWREFYADVLWHRPDSAWSDLRASLAGMAYDDPVSDPGAAGAFEAWRAGRTGFPLVDAGMRQLSTTGWIHNRVRMVTASFLVKDLHIWWPHGARHFLNHLRDGDVASNNHGWQWVAGSGTDAAPYFRVFNPVSQGLKYDPNGRYVRRYLPELAHLPGKTAHEPWKAADGHAHGYPERILDHAAERAEALRRYEAARR